MRSALSAMAVVATATIGAPGCTHEPATPTPADAYVNVDAPANNVGAGSGGGLLDNLSFAIVGDTRPMNIDDTAHYPTDVITRIWMDVASEAVPPPFAITTGDYMYAATNFAEQGPQLDIYLGARANYPSFVYPAMGNHECNGYTESNCGQNLSDGEPANYTEFMTRMIQPIGESHPYYIERFAAKDGSWSAKFVFVAGNSWTADEQGWLENVLGEPTTYTFVVRHEPVTSFTAPGVTPSQGLINLAPLTLLIVGHTHTYEHLLAERELIVGTGGAPLSGGANYGYVMVSRNADASLTFTEYDYLTHDVTDTFKLAPDGTVL